MKTKDLAPILESRLYQTFGELGPTLIFHNDRECLISILLSAQTTDISVNKVTPALFKRFPTFSSLAEAIEEEIYPYISSLGLAHSKAKSLHKLGILFKNRGTEEIPHDFEFLTSLPGVGIKTAGVFLIERDKAKSFPVDTHIFRVTRRLGLTRAKDPTKAGEKLYLLYPEEKAAYMHRAFITLGRKYCKALQPLCKECPVQEYCPKANHYLEGK